MYDGLNVKSTLHNIGINQSTSISLQLAKYEAKIYMTINVHYRKRFKYCGKVVTIVTSHSWDVLSTSEQY